MKSERIITIGREFGSGGYDIAHLVADKLRLPFYDKELIELASEKSGLNKEFFERADEKRSFSLQGGVAGLRSSLMEQLSAGYLLSNESLFTIQCEVIRELSQKGSAIFIGRCADYILKDYPALLTVFITASVEDRIARVIERREMSHSAAADLIEKMDKRRSSYYNYFSDKKWGASHSYDLVLNSSSLGISGAANIVAAAFNL
ncbi:MAG: cytidylate kinase-like family protein [Bacteroidales bacterium]